MLIPITMENKTPVSALKEFSDKAKTGNPKYYYIRGDDGTYVCTVVLMNIEALGNGRSKRDAKHRAAGNIIRQLNSKYGKKEDTFNFSSMAKELTNVNHDTLASIKRYGKSCVISNDAEKADTEIHLTSAKPQNTEHILEDLLSEDLRKIKTYRELTDIAEKKLLAQIFDRHNYFKKNYPHLKEAAFEAMNSKEYGSSKTQSMAVLDALQLTLRTTTLKSKSIEPILMIELDCENDACFMGLESEIYEQIIDYFRIMLV